MVFRLTRFTFLFVWRGVLTLLPYLFRIAWKAAESMVFAAAILVADLPEKIKDIADEWISEYAEAGHSAEYQSWLFILACAVATITFFIGWILLAFLTVFLVRLLF